ncbi:MAG TPA: hypothetical protein VHB23_14920 [Devosiaceae bacterium]|nr:hypothetical protein [Devosiaceae bacterium]
MRRGIARAVLIAMMLAGSAAAASADEASVNAAIDADLGDHALYQTTISAFQDAVANRNKQDVAAFVRYPIVVTINGHKRTIRSSAAFVAAYDQIMTPDIVDAVTKQQYGDLFVNDQGIMFGNGEVWIHGLCLDRGCRHFVPKVVTIQHTGS